MDLRVLVKGNGGEGGEFIQRRGLATTNNKSALMEKGGSRARSQKKKKMRERDIWQKAPAIRLGEKKLRLDQQIKWGGGGTAWEALTQHSF